MANEDATAVKDEVVADTTTPESAPEETQEAVADEDALNDDAFDDIKDVPLDPSQRETESPEQSGAEETKPQPQDDKTPSPKDDWDSLNGKSQERFQQMANERREAQRRIAELEARQAQFATEQDLVNEINPETGIEYTPQEIERISWLQSREAQAERANQELYGLQVQQNQAAIDDEARQVMELPMFNPGNKDEFKPQVAEQYAQALNDVLIYQLPDGQQANRSTLLANGINPDTQATLVSYSMSPLKLAKLIVDSYSGAKTQGETIGQAKAQRATEKMLANADPAAGSSSASGKDDDLDDFDKAWDEYAN